VSFTDTSTNSPTAWTWDFGEGIDSGSSQRNPVYTYAKPGTYTVKLTVSKAGGGSSSSSKQVTVTAPPVPAPPKPTAGFTSQASGLTVTFADVSSGTPTTWSWEFGDGTFGSDRNPVHSYAQAGTYTVKLTAANAAGSGVVTQPITVQAPLVAPVEVPLNPSPPTGAVQSPRLKFATSGRALSLLRNGLPITISGASGKRLVVTATVSKDLARRARLHRRVLVSKAITPPTTTRLRVSKPIVDALRRAHGKLTVTITVSGAGTTPLSRIITLRR
jgi:hypothetical protein